MSDENAKVARLNLAWAIKNAATEEIAVSLLEEHDAKHAEEVERLEAERDHVQRKRVEAARSSTREIERLRADTRARVERAASEALCLANSWPGKTPGEIIVRAVAHAMGDAPAYSTEQPYEFSGPDPRDIDPREPTAVEAAERGDALLRELVQRDYLNPALAIVDEIKDHLAARAAEEESGGA